MTTQTAKSTKAPGKTEAKIESTRIGVVESDKRDKTRRVVVPNVRTHPKYGKVIRRRTVLQVHDEKNISHTGDLVEIVPCRPVSKTKRWALLRIVRAGARMKFEGVEVPGKDNAEAPAAPAAPAAKSSKPAKPGAKG